MYQVEPERYVKVSFRNLPNDLIRTQYDVESVSEEELMLAISELAYTLSPGLIIQLMRRLDEILSERQKGIEPHSSGVN